jgi:hypothetical protein
MDSPWPYLGENDSGPTPFIRLRQSDISGKTLNGARLWATAIFELYNVQNSAAFDRINDDAWSGKVSKNEWIRRNTALEYSALRKKALFFRTIWQANARKRGMPSDADYWNQEMPKTYESWLTQYKSPQGYPYDTWGKYYTDQIEPFLRRKAWHMQKSISPHPPQREPDK